MVIRVLPSSLANEMQDGSDLTQDTRGYENIFYLSKQELYYPPRKKEKSPHHVNEISSPVFKHETASDHFLGYTKDV